ncbi:DUF47 domain-containing protein [Desulfovibrio legallii]|jgi:uncharacterized protein Yka (UPF0111/DUF47 family)|uniref:DUF47 family protein n=2 Tax=Desulfovibrio TaxID=872 RepID=A0A6H3F6P9_9BACT|nr:DUF47 family protein [Desulfovibrio legallii]RHH19201.1 DUF47 family protein [Desulfovibrio sp. AM18-2]TBH78592.1 DUF47 family protein [Desulfovibrio legallii]CAI3240782.1 Phosphate transport regulator (distant homolog of PhoU) [Desulfovibrio diazotrophicus]
MFPALLPKSAPFFAMLEEQNGLLRRMAGMLVEMLEDVSRMDAIHKEIAFQEESADVLHGKIIRALSQTFITPIDREDILRINQEQEECMDCLHSLSTRLHIFEFTRIRFPALQMVRTIGSMIDLTRLMLEGLANRRDCHKTRAFRNLRGECDMLLAVGLAELMDEHQELSPSTIMQVLKWSQAYERMGILLEQVNALAETLEEAVLKNV